jgi:MGT family glycosyltransferase
MVPDVLAVIRDWAPDLLVHEDGEFGGCIAAERTDLPHATVQVTAYRSRIGPMLADPLNHVRKRHGLPVDPDMQMLHRYLFLATVPSALHDPADQLPNTAHPLRPVAYDRSADERLPAWVAELPMQPTVYLTLGANNGDRLDVFTPFLEGLGGEPLNLLVTVGQTGNPEALGRLAPNIRAERYVPQTLLLPRCQALAFHGGSGTMLSALAHALPMVMVPLAADQPENAERCAAAGVARALPSAGLSPGAACEAVLDVLRNPDYRRNAERVRTQIEGMPGPDQVVPLLARLAAERTPMVLSGGA